MKTKTKEFDFATLVFNHDTKRKILFIDFLKRGDVFFRTTILHVKTTFVYALLQNLTEKIAKDIYLNNMDIL